MDIKELCKGYFQLEDSQKASVVFTATKYYVQDMAVAGGTLGMLRDHLRTLQERSMHNDDYEVSEVLGEVLGGIELVINDLEEENDNV
jgi:hypothetical protein